MGTFSRRGDALWAPILEQARAYLNANPHASCSDAARHLGINTATLHSRLTNEYDWKERRRQRGLARSSRRTITKSATDVVALLKNIQKDLRAIAVWVQRQDS